MKKASIKKILFLPVLSVLFWTTLGSTENVEKALMLQEMTWTDVEEYLKTNDMVIIPMGSTEQHGPHLPLGTDTFIATKSAMMVSARTGVLIAPVVLAGYSVYHSGFPGTLSLRPETMEQVLFETVEMLIKYGFRRIMFLNGHGGNSIVQSNLIHRINHSTEAIAVAIGYDAPFQGEMEPPKDWFEQHAGVDETSVMLYLEPDLVHMERAEKPDIHFSPQMQKYLLQRNSHPGMMGIFWSLLATPKETGKEGASHQISSNGVWSFSDPNDATREMGENSINKVVENIVKFIEAWKQVPPEKK